MQFKRKLPGGIKDAKSRTPAAVYGFNEAIYQELLNAQEARIKYKLNVLFLQKTKWKTGTEQWRNSDL